MIGWNGPLRKLRVTKVKHFGQFHSQNMTEWKLKLVFLFLRQKLFWTMEQKILLQFTVVIVVKNLHSRI